MHKKFLLILLTLSLFQISRGMKYTEITSEEIARNKYQLMDIDKDYQHSSRYALAPSIEYRSTRICIAKAIQQGANPNSFMGDALVMDDYWLLKYLLDHGADAQAKIEGRPAITCAKSIPLAKILLEHRAQVTETDNIFGGVLHAAVGMTCSVELLRYYLENYGTILDLNSKSPMMKETPLELLHRLSYTYHYCGYEGYEEKKYMLEVAMRKKRS